MSAKIYIFMDDANHQLQHFIFPRSTTRDEMIRTVAKIMNRKGHIASDADGCITLKKESGIEGNSVLINLIRGSGLYE